MSNSDLKYTSIHYHSYLQLDKILNAQKMRSKEDGKEAHDEMLFIIIHQVYELWFKQMIHDMTSVVKLFKQNKVDEKSIGPAVQRINRVNEILKLLIKQIDVLETMTPLDFLDFRSYLVPASGFQSFQFRMLEDMLGLPEESRVVYNNIHYRSEFEDEKQQQLADISRNQNLFKLINQWLERTPFLSFGDFQFLEEYRQAVNRMLNREEDAINSTSFLSDEDKKGRLKMLKGSEDYYKSVLNKYEHEKLMEKGEVRLSYKATVAALFINLYRDQPILHEPYLLLQSLVDVDELLTNWRYRHAQMVQRMLGKKIGTGGSTGHGYLEKTASKHHIFSDLHNISTLLIPRSELPPLPDNLIQQLSFYYSKHGNS